MGRGARDPGIDAGRSPGGPPRQRGRGAWPWLLLAALLLVLALAASTLFLVLPSEPTPTATGTRPPARTPSVPETLTAPAMATWTRTPPPTASVIVPPVTATRTPVDTVAVRQTPTERPGPGPTGTAAGAATPTPTPTVQVETGEGAEITDISTLGEVNIEYPIRMAAGSSDVVVLSVYVPAMLASLVPIEVERVEIPADAPAVAGELNRYRATILVAGTMRIELQSLGFAVEDLYPATQAVDIDEVNKATVWAWTVQAPERPGTYVLVVRAYRIGEGDEARPSWIRSLSVDVVSPPEPRGVRGLGWIVAAVVLGNVLVAAALVLILRRRRGLLPTRRPPYDLAVLRELLLASFGPQELRRLCQSHPDLRPVLDDLDADPSLNEVVDAVVDHVERHDLYAVLLALVREHNPRQYARFESRLHSRP